jgi:hypothetical protein
MWEPRIYFGERIALGGVQVFRDGEPLRIEPSQAVRLHSESFEWGYSGSGPAQLALAICLDVFSKEVAVSIYQDFKFAVVAGFDRETWSIDAICMWAGLRLAQTACGTTPDRG